VLSKAITAVALPSDEELYKIGCSDPKVYLLKTSP
jgi:hypothetical protein